MFLAVFLLALLISYEKLLVHGKYVTPAVVFECGKPKLYLTTEGWIQDTLSPCVFTTADIIHFCRKVYADKSISHAVFSPVVHDLLRGWCNPHNTTCSETLDEIHTIQPWICTDNKPSQLTIPPGCEVKTFGGLSGHSCHKDGHWFKVASTHCSKVTEVEPIKPCIKSGSYLHSHFLGVKAVCCKIHLPIEHNGGSSFAIPHVNPHYNTLGDGQSAKFRERQNFLHTKQTQQATLNSAKSLLLQKLLTAESQLTDKDWLEHPEDTQKAEDVIIEDFRHDYLNLSVGAQQTRHRLESAHQKRVLDFMRQNEATMMSLLDSMVSRKPVNFSRLLEHMERVLHVIENNRFHVLKKIEHLRSLNVGNTTEEVVMLKERLVELDKVFNTSLSKLNKVPKYQPTIVQHIEQLRKTEYSHVESFAKSMLVATVPSRNHLDEEAATLEAEELIDRYRHHFIGNNTSDGLVDSWRKKHGKKQHPTREVLTPAHLSNGPVDVSESVLNSSSADNDSKLMKLSGQPATNRHSNVVTGVIVFTFLLVALLCVMFVLRHYRRRARLSRAGYTSSLVEVDEINNTGRSTVPDTQVEDADVLTYWIPGGFENPSYKYSDKLIR